MYRRELVWNGESAEEKGGNVERNRRGVSIAKLQRSEARQRDASACWNGITMSDFELANPINIETL